jgi:acetyltransferase-like isoleucine patch superfamily enzyme
MVEKSNLQGIKKIGVGNTIRELAKFGRPHNIVIGNHCIIDDFVIIAGGRTELTIIEDHVHIACFSSCLGIAGFTFELGSGLSPGCSLFSSTDDYIHGGLINPTFPDEFRNEKVGRVTMGRFSTLGANCVVLAGITIGEGATVGSGAVIINDLEPWTVSVGIPAKPIKMRNKEKVLENWNKYLDSLKK